MLNYLKDVEINKAVSQMNDIVKKTGLDVLGKCLKTRQAVWFGHVIRMETRLPRIAMCEEIRLKNKSGRPRQKWIDNLLETFNFTKEAATTLAKESRELWRCSIYEGASVLQCKPQVVRSHAMYLRSKPTQRIRLWWWWWLPSSHNKINIFSNWNLSISNNELNKKQ